MEISAIWIRRIGDEINLCFEGEDGFWCRATKENIDGAFSCIVELNHTGNGPDAGKPRPLSDFPRDSL